MAADRSTWSHSTSENDPSTLGRSRPRRPVKQFVKSTELELEITAQLYEDSDDSGSEFVPSPAASEDEDSTLEEQEGGGEGEGEREGGVGGVLNVVLESDKEIGIEEETNIPDKTPRKGRKRVRDEQNWKKNIRKRLRNSGKEYVNVKGNVVPAKSIVFPNCGCKEECHKIITEEQRLALMKQYYNLENFDLQTSFLCTLVTVKSKQRVYTATNTKKRENTRVYTLPDAAALYKKVCKTFFKDTFKVSDGRLTRALKGKVSGTTPPLDKRGRHPPVNKTIDEKIEKVKEFIKKFPSYESHYSRKKNPNRKFLSQHLNINIMYNLYKQQERSPVSLYTFTRVFNRDFNLHFHAPLSDTCRKCDAWEIQIKGCHDNDAKEKLKEDKDLHLSKAEAARNGMRLDAEKGKNDKNVTVIAFDLMKTLATPVLSTGVCYYKRQLWTYNLGIHNLSTNEAHMYVWDESKASRGSQEIGSCLMDYVKKNVTTDKLIMYSDQCSGQNRNIKIALICSYMVASENFNVKDIAILL